MAKNSIFDGRPPATTASFRSVRIGARAYRTPVLEASASMARRGRKHHARGLEHAKNQRWSEAARAFAEAVSCAPDQPDFNFALGGALSRLDRLDEAFKAYTRELAIMPGDTPTLAELGACLARMGRRSEAIMCLKTALQRRPNMAFAQYNLGLALLTEKRRVEAIEALTHAIGVNPTYADAFRVRGLAHALGGDAAVAARDFEAAAAIQTDNHEAMLWAATRFAQHAQDGDAHRLFEMAAKAAPNIALPQCVFGHFLIANRRYEHGMDYVERALKLDPLFADAYVARGFGLLGQGRVAEAIANYRRAGELKPEDPHIAGTLLFALQHQPGITKEELLNAHKNWATLYRPQAPQDRRAFSNDRSARKLRIGVVSGDLRRHAVTFLTLRAFEQLASLGHRLYCYKTDRKFPDDEFSARYKAISAAWTDVSDLDDPTFCRLIAEQKIDVLIDLSGHTAGNRLGVFAMRAAPVQLSWAGYVGTIGLDSYEGVIADPVEIPPEHDACYVERPIRLPDCYICYQPPLRAPEVAALPALKNGFVTFGCFNRPAKLNVDVACAWARILERTPRSRLLLVYGGLQEASTRAAVYKILDAGGVRRDRVELIGEAEQAKLLEAYATRVDLALDPFPYSGGVTTLEAMWMGVPTVTIVGETFAGRHSATHLTAAGLAEFCAPSVDAYVDLAVNRAGRPQVLAELRATLRDKLAHSPLMDAPAFARHLDAALHALWDEWRMSP